MKQVVMQSVVVLSQAETTQLLWEPSDAEANPGRNNGVVQHALLHCLAVATAVYVRV